MEPESSEVQGEFLTTGPPGKTVRFFSLVWTIFFFFFVVNFVIHWNETTMGLHVFPIFTVAVEFVTIVLPLSVSFFLATRHVGS